MRTEKVYTARSVKSLRQHTSQSKEAVRRPGTTDFRFGIETTFDVHLKNLSEILAISTNSYLIPEGLSVTNTICE